MRYVLTWYSWLVIIAALYALFIFGAVYPLWRTRKQKGPIQKKKGARRVGALILSISSLIGFIMLFEATLEPYRIVERTVTINLGSPRPFSVALISDIQTSPFKTAAFVDRVTQRIAERKPAAILYAGDFVNNELPMEQELPHLEALRGMANIAPIIGVPGNHEYGISNPAEPARHPDVHERVLAEVGDIGVAILKNELITVMHPDGTPLFEVYGFDDLWNPRFVSTPLPPRALAVFDTNQNTTKKIPRLALSHNPDTIYMVDEETADMVVSGHTHGGQIRLPWFGAFVSVATKLETRYYKGLSEHNGIPLYVTSGLGESGPPLRFLNPPEIVFLHIQ